MDFEGRFCYGSFILRDCIYMCKSKYVWWILKEGFVMDVELIGRKENVGSGRVLKGVE